MRAVWLEDGQIRIRDDADAPVATTGEALLRVTTAGICGTDLELVRGYRPFRGVPGHEFVGVAIEGPWQGRRVVAEINVTCPIPDERDDPEQAGTGLDAPCAACLAGRAAHCERREVLGLYGRDGAFAEYVRVPVRNLHPVPDAVPDPVAVFVEPLAAALRILDQVEVTPSARALVVGPGRLGTLVARVLASAGARVEVAVRSEGAFSAARDRGLTPIASEEVAAGVYDLVVDCTGHPSGFGVARAAVRPRGTLVLKSTYSGELTTDLSGLVVDEVRVIGSRCGPFPAALDALAEGGVRVEDLVERAYPLEEAVEAFAHAGRPGAMKILLEP